jgi:hypothetical protein
MKNHILTSAFFLACVAGLASIGLPPVSRTPRLGVMMELEVCHGSQAIYAGVQG